MIGRLVALSSLLVWNPIHADCVIETRRVLALFIQKASEGFMLFLVAYNHRSA